MSVAGRWLWVVLALAAGGVDAAGVVPPPGAIDARVREIEYREAQVVQLTGYVGYHIHLTLEASERFVALAAGDAAAIEVAAEGPHVMLKPRAAVVATNLTLVSTRRVYHFEYRTAAGPPPAGTALFALRFRYPSPATVADGARGEGRGSVGAAAPATAVAARFVNRDYWYCGSPWLQPMAVSDDGVQTRLTFAERGEWPAIFVANADGSESLTNFHAEGTTAVIHRVAARFVLRRGRLTGCIENRGYAGSGAWVAGGALDPASTRAVRP